MTEYDLVGAALLSPGFASDLSTWRLTINRDSLLSQEIRVANYEDSYRAQMRQESTRLPSDELMAIVALAERTGFRNFRDRYEHETMVVLDLPTLSISIRFGELIKTVEAYGPREIAAQENNQDMVRFVELWNHIHRYAPYPSQAESVIHSTQAFFAIPRNWQQD